MKQQKKRGGFTLTELMVVLVIMAILLAIGIPAGIHYLRIARFRQNEENAKTAFMAAESSLTYYRASGQWDSFKEKVMQEGSENPEPVTGAVGRIYAIILDAKSAQDDPDNAVLDLLDARSYEASFLSGAIGIEIDVETGKVYSAFYATNCTGLVYAGTDENAPDGYLNMNDRTYDSRKKVGLGYYSTEDLTNVVDLDPIRLKINSVSLVNNETLSLNWSSNSRHQNLDVDFHLTFYLSGSGDESERKLFEVTVNRADIQKSSGWSGQREDVSSIVSLPVTASDGSTSDWSFPVLYNAETGTFSLVLDAMMSADVLAMQTNTDQTAFEDTAELLHHTFDVSVTRLAQITGAGALASDQKIYATIQAVSTYKNMDGDTREYSQSRVASSNTAHTLYGDDTQEKNGTLQAEISVFRHLSNIRYAGKAAGAVFQVTNRNMDWNSAGIGLYDTAELDRGQGRTELVLKWTPESASLQFPAIPSLAEGQTLQGKNSNIRISNLRLGEDSVVGDAEAEKMTAIPLSHYVGLFCESEGTIHDLIFQDPTLTIGDGAYTGENTGTASETLTSLWGAALLAGRNTGDIENITIRTSDTDTQIVNVNLPDRRGESASQPAAVGALVGLMANTDENGNLNTAQAVSAQIQNVSVAGTLQVHLPGLGLAETGKSAEETAVDYVYGVGGIFGYAYAGTELKVEKCENHADISGNLFVGGIGGMLHGVSGMLSNEDSEAEIYEKSAVRSCGSDGLILCNVSTKDENRLEGRYFGGIIGFAGGAALSGDTSASGRSASYRYDVSQRNLLNGRYVGGIVGYASNSMLQNCNTEKNGYILGSDYVGGILGGMGGSIADVIHQNTEGGVSVTVNAAYVIGENYVGGIVGRNDGGTAIRNCVNNGVAAGYGSYIGGIAGYNGRDESTGAAVISDCASYISDPDGSIYRMIVDTWQATGSFAGGLAGYNDGEILFNQETTAASVPSISGIVVGEDYVGGVIGFNDVHGTMDVDYVLIGGDVYAYGDCAGGCIGFNASEEILTTENLVMKPRSVQGGLYVGGCIGANAVALSKDVKMSGFSTDNTTGTITGQAYVGGIIGYARTYEKTQLGLTEDTMEEYMRQNKSRLLPELSDENLPESVLESANPYTLTITTLANEGVSLEQYTYTNDMPIRAYVYAGGIVGYCEENSNLVMKYCQNRGEITLPDDGTYAGASAGVSLQKYLQSEGLSDASAALPDREEILVSMIGGVIGVNQKEQIVDACSNTARLAGLNGVGGIVGLNAGGVFNCVLADSLDNTGYDYTGGIAGLNVNPGANRTSYLDTQGKTQSYLPGTISDCTTKADYTVSGRNGVGGLVGYNLKDACIRDSVSEAGVNAGGDFVGGLAGINDGQITVGTDYGQARSISSRSGESVGGLVGWNRATGSLYSAASAGAVVNASVSVTGARSVGGVAGTNEGEIRAYSTAATASALVCRAGQVRALEELAGGIAGVTSGENGNITNAINECGEVSADLGSAGGITAENHVLLDQCVSRGAVRSSAGYAGGIAAVNYGTIRDSTVESGSIYSQNTEALGAVCAVNEKDGLIQTSTAASAVTLSGDADIYGAIAGANRGTIRTITLSAMPSIPTSGKSLQVGGAAGQNAGIISKVQVTADFTGRNGSGFTNYQYLGGIVGENLTGARVSDSSYAGTIKEGSSATGNCYGGIAGANSGRISDCSVSNLSMDIVGVYTATSGSSAEQKETLAVQVGGIAGKNKQNATITGCTLENVTNSSITVASGMLGGVAGYNRGTISNSGDAAALQGILNATKLDEITGTPKNDTITWRDNAQVENLRYSSGGSVSAGHMKLVITSNGNVGGITAYNAPEGKLSRCASGDWFINNKSAAAGVGTGGIIGMNESEKDQEYLLNQAFVGRYMSSSTTNRFAGGIIGNQNNTTNGGWKMRYCVNYGMVYCHNAHYSGGIIGQWSGTGGTIEYSRNYGSLQTTSYSMGWVGAAGGIVAQLYHPYEGHEYNIVHCGNFGSIFGRYGRSTSDAANDSAGILGNVTAHDASSISVGTNCTIQVLDCDNASGVEIYSGSMASGIVGFFSTDSTETNWINNITNATSNIVLRIERCRNFAKTLQGRQFLAGIFGDRYGETGARNTYIYDCYSVESNQYYSGAGNEFPIVSMTNGSGKPGLVNSSGNCIFSNQSPDYRVITYTNAKQDGANGAVTGQTSLTGTEARLPGCTRIFTAYQAEREQYVLFEMYNGHQYEPGWGWIGRDDKMLYVNWWPYGSAGSVRYYFDASVSLSDSDSMAKITSSGNPFYQYVREVYHNMEGTDASGSRLLAPETFSANVSGGEMSLTVTPQKDASGNAYNPFGYRVRVTNEGGESYTYDFYTETANFTLPFTDMTNLKVVVQAFSMYEDVAASEWITSDDIHIEKVLPAPDIRIELVRRDPYVDGNYGYKFSLNNLQEYIDGGFDNWRVTIQFRRGTQTITLNAANPEVTALEGRSSALNDQLVVQAFANEARDSEQETVDVYLPGYAPNVALKWTYWSPNYAEPSVSVTGTNLSDLSINVTLDGANTGIQSTTPIYRAEITGTWNGINNVVFASQDILVSAGGKATATFRNLPEYLAQATNVGVRIYYAQSGLGPVYSYHISDTQETNSNVMILKNVAADGTPEWQYGTCLILNSGFDSYKYTIGNILSWLKAPVLEDTGTLLTPSYDANGRLQYTFAWDAGKGTAFESNRQYEFSLSGKNAAGNSVIISTGESTVQIRQLADGRSAYTLTVDAEDWNYTEVQLTVTRIGTSTGSQTGSQIGLTSTGSYSVRQRLARPGQPSVNNPDINELKYNIRWTALSPETGCGSYDVYIQPYAAAADLTQATLAATVAADGSASYLQNIDLEAYAGTRILIYVVARAENGSQQYIDSQTGVTYTLRVPARIAAPTVTWSQNWSYDRMIPVTRSAFESTGLIASLTADAGSIPPGGSTYLLKAYVYDSETAAKNGTGSLLDTGLLAVYPEASASGTITPASMETVSSTVYRHTIQGLSAQYAGRWIVFYARISSGNSNASSQWVDNRDNPVRLPYVRLDTVSATTFSRTEEITANVKDHPDFGGQDRTWSASHLEFEWTAVAHADAYEFTVYEKTEAQSEIAHTFRVREAEDGTITVWSKNNTDGTWTLLGQESTAAGQTAEIDLSGAYSTELTGSYITADGADAYYSVTSGALLEVSAATDGTTLQYTLRLPDIQSLTDSDGTAITGISSLISTKAEFTADRYANLDDTQADSDAFTASETQTVNLQNL